MFVVTLLSLLLAVPQQISHVSPPEGATGAVLTVQGSGFGTKKPSLRLVDPVTGKKVSLAVGAWGETQVTATLKKGTPAGVRDVVLRPKLKGATDLVAPGAFEVRAPVPQWVEPGVVEGAGPVTIHGQFFGTRRGKVRLGGKPLKVSSWSESVIVAIVPKKAPGGVLDIVVKNSAASTTLSAGLVVLGADTLTGPDLLAVRVDGVAAEALGSPGVVALQTVDRLHVGADLGAGRTLQITLPLDVATLAVPLKLAGDPAGSVTLRERLALLDPAASSWTTSGQGEDYEVQLLALVSGRLVGTFRATVARVEGSAPPATLSLESGLFLATVPESQ